MLSRTLVALALCCACAARAGEPPAELLLAEGVQRYQAGELRAAVSLFERALQQQPTLVAAGHHLGLAYLRLGRLAEGRRLLARMVRLAPQRPRLLADLGLAYLAEGNLAWAVRYLRAACDRDPHDGQIRNQLATALLRFGEPGAAVEELWAAQHSPGLDWEELRLRLGLAYYQQGAWEASRELIEPLLVRKQHALASQLMRATYEAEGDNAAWVSGELAISAVVNTNPLYEHEMSAPAAMGPGIAGALTLRPWVSTSSLVWGELAASRLFYLAALEDEREKDPATANPTELRAMAGYRRRLATPRRGALQLGLGYTFDLTFLDGEPPLADRHHIFVEQHSGHIAVEHKGSESGATTQLRASVARADFADLARSNWGLELSLEHGFGFAQERGRLLGWLFARHEAAQASDYDAFVPGGGVGLSYTGPLGLVFGARLGYEHANHYRSAEGRWAKQRLDNSLEAMAEIGRALFWGLRLRAIYQRLQHFSTVTDFDYSRNLATLNLSWSSS